MESITITANLARSAVVLKAIRAEEVPQFFQNILAKHKQNYGSKYTQQQIIAVINLSKIRILRIRGKVWDQLVDGDSIWLVTNQEWQEYCDNVLNQEQLYRHGKRIVHQHPNSLSPEKLQHFVSQYYEGSKPVDPMKKFSSPPPSVRPSPPKKTVPLRSADSDRNKFHVNSTNHRSPLVPKGKAIADVRMIEAVKNSLSPKMNLPPSTIKKSSQFTTLGNNISTKVPSQLISQQSRGPSSSRLPTFSTPIDPGHDINELYSEYKESFPSDFDISSPPNVQNRSSLYPPYNAGSEYQYYTEEYLHEEEKSEAANPEEEREEEMKGEDDNAKEEEEEEEVDLELTLPRYNNNDWRADLAATEEFDPTMEAKYDASILPTSPTTYTNDEIEKDNDDSNELYSDEFSDNEPYEEDLRDHDADAEVKSVTDDGDKDKQATIDNNQLQEVENDQVNHSSSNREEDEMETFSDMENNEFDLPLSVNKPNSVTPSSTAVVYNLDEFINENEDEDEEFLSPASLKSPIPQSAKPWFGETSHQPYSLYVRGVLSDDKKDEAKQVDSPSDSAEYAERDDEDHHYEALIGDKVYHERLENDQQDEVENVEVASEKEVDLKIERDVFERGGFINEEEEEAVHEVFENQETVLSMEDFSEEQEEQQSEQKEREIEKMGKTPENAVNELSSDELLPSVTLDSRCAPETNFYGSLAGNSVIRCNLDGPDGNLNDLEASSVDHSIISETSYTSNIHSPQRSKDVDLHNNDTADVLSEGGNDSSSSDQSLPIKYELSIVENDDNNSYPNSSHSENASETSSDNQAEDVLLSSSSSEKWDEDLADQELFDVSYLDDIKEVPIVEDSSENIEHREEKLELRSEYSSLSANEDEERNDISTLDPMNQDIFDRSDNDVVERKIFDEIVEEFTKEIQRFVEVAPSSQEIDKMDVDDLMDEYGLSDTEGDYEGDEEDNVIRELPLTSDEEKEIKIEAAELMKEKDEVIMDGKNEEDESLLEEKSEKDEDFVDEKSEEAEDIMGGKNEEDENLLDEESEEVEALVDEKSEEAEDIIDEKSEDDEDIIDEKSEEDENLLDGESEEVGALVDEKIEEVEDIMGLMGENDEYGSQPIVAKEQGIEEFAESLELRDLISVVMGETDIDVDAFSNSEAEDYIPATSEDILRELSRQEAIKESPIGEPCFVDDNNVQLEEIEVVEQSEDLSFCITESIPETEELDSLFNLNDKDFVLDSLHSSPGRSQPFMSCGDINEPPANRNSSTIGLKGDSFMDAASRVFSAQVTFDNNVANPLDQSLTGAPMVEEKTYEASLNQDNITSKLRRIQSEGLSVSFYLNDANVSTDEDEAVQNQSIASDGSIYTKFRRQADELAELRIEKAALEARLEETRYLLQMFAGLTPRMSKINLREKDYRLSPFSHVLPNMIDELEDTIKDISVETIERDAKLAARRGGEGKTDLTKGMSNQSVDSKDSSLTSSPEENLNITKARRVSRTLQQSVEEATSSHHSSSSFPASENHSSSAFTLTKVEEAVQTEHVIADDEKSSEDNGGDKKNLILDPLHEESDNPESNNLNMSRSDGLRENEISVEDNYRNPDDLERELPHEQIHLLTSSDEYHGIGNNLTSATTLLLPESEFPTVFTHDVLHLEQPLALLNTDIQTNTDLLENDVDENGPSSGSKSNSLVKRIEALKQRRKMLMNPTSVSEPIISSSIPASDIRERGNDVYQEMKIGSPKPRENSSSPIPTLQSEDYGVFKKPRAPGTKITPRSSISKDHAENVVPKDQSTEVMKSLVSRSNEIVSLETLENHDTATKSQPVPSETLKSQNNAVLLSGKHEEQERFKDLQGVSMEAVTDLQESAVHSILIEQPKIVQAELAAPNIEEEEGELDKADQKSSETVDPEFETDNLVEDLAQSPLPALAEEEEQSFIDPPHLQKEDVQREDDNEKLKIKLTESDGKAGFVEVQPLIVVPETTEPHDSVGTLPEDLFELAKHPTPSAKKRFVFTDTPATKPINFGHLTPAKKVIDENPYIENLQPDEGIKNELNVSIDYIDVSRPEVVSPLSMNSDLMMVEKNLETHIQYSEIEHEHSYLPPSTTHRNTRSTNSSRHNTSADSQRSNSRGRNSSHNVRQPSPKHQSRRGSQKSEAATISRVNETPKVHGRKVVEKSRDQPEIFETSQGPRQASPPNILEKEPQVNMSEFISSPVDEDEEPTKTSLAMHETDNTLYSDILPVVAQPSVTPTATVTVTENIVNPSSRSSPQPEEQLKLIQEEKAENNKKSKEEEDGGKFHISELSEGKDEIKQETEIPTVIPTIDAPLTVISNDKIDITEEKEETIDEMLVTSPASDDKANEEKPLEKDSEERKKEIEKRVSPKRVTLDTSHQDDDGEDVLDTVSPFSMLSVGVDPTASASLVEISALVNYFYPFLLTAKYLEDSALRGYRGRKHLLQSLLPPEIIAWLIFQLFGTTEGILVKQIKTTQISRLLQDAKIMKLPSTQLDLQLVKIHARLSAQKAVSHGVKAPIMTKTGTMAIIQTGRKVVVGANPRTDPSALNNASFVAFIELLKSLTISNTSNNSSQLKSSSASVSNTSTAANAKGNYVLERVSTYFKDLLVQRDLNPYEQLIFEAKMSVSGVLLRTPYSKYLQAPTRLEEIQRMGQKLNIRIHSDHDIEHVRQVWERNLDQIRLIYNYYAAAVESRRFGSGPLKLLMNVDNCKEMLQDFQLLPQLIDVQTFHRLFRSCKLWEWEIGEIVVRVANSKRSPSSDEHSETKSMYSSFSNLQGSGMGGYPASVVSRSHDLDPADPFDFKGTIGHFSLSLWGYLELLSRIASYQNKLGHYPPQALENMMHLMDASNGKNKLLSSASRKSISVRHFTYASKK